MADFLRVELEDGSVALFEASESVMVSMHSGRPDIEDAADITAERFEGIARTVASMAKRVRDMAAPDEISIEVELGISGEVGWFFAKSSASGSVKLTLTWAGDRDPAS
ncbi:CU044_2847 family protein [Glutamicibacter ardleyensis]|uniref:CU044_2847 family protein n=1 Tax=Glutamicibacter ardleyensis TaxID=225894 RepID=UPI003FD34AD8